MVRGEDSGVWACETRAETMQGHPDQASPPVDERGLAGESWGLMEFCLRTRWRRGEKHLEKTYGAAEPRRNSTRTDRPKTSKTERRPSGSSCAIFIQVRKKFLETFLLV